ncbi:hypothetical protein D9M68_939310 [compost metagenome]
MRAGAQGAHRELGFGVDGEHDDAQGGVVGAHGFQDVEAVAFAQGHVQHHGVVAGLAQGAQGGGGVGGFVYQGDARVFFQDAGQASADDEVVVDDEQVQGHGAG